MHFPGHGEDHGAGRGRPMVGVLQWAMVVTLGFVALELVAGYVANSIALVSDAFHNLSDVPTLVISWLAIRWSERPADSQKTYGYHRAGILAAYTNATLLVLVALYILYEAYERLRWPVTVDTGWMIGVSLAGLGVNGGITLALIRSRRDLNLRSILVHNLGDALSNVGILAGALVIYWSGARWVDPAIGAAIGLLVMWSSYGILRESSHILLEGLPRQMLLEEVAAVMLEVEGVTEVHDVHIWTLGTDLYALSCHIRIPDMHLEESESILEEIRKRLEKKFHITHTTIQFERAGLPREAGLFMPEPLNRSKA